MNPEKTFRAVIQGTDSGGAYVTIPFDVEEVFGKKRLPVRATFDGHPYRGLLVRMGGPDHVLIILKEIREAIGKQAGDEVEVTVEEDLEPRVVEVPEDLQEALRDDPEASSFFDSLSYTHRREYVRWIEEAKRAETRARRVVQTVEKLRAGRKAR